MLKLLLSMIPIGIVGFTLKDRARRPFGVAGDPARGGVYAAGDGGAARFRLLRQAPAEGAALLPRRLPGSVWAQAVAALPGLSRSGSTIATGLLLGNRKQTVAQFSFLMVLAPILGEPSWN